ncbi:Soluble lytic murein transglycosylase [Myxococcus hansupus]|uniref:Soluble lytic murein transglycosylase n=1 Tax=Pseudomyxococcus hansupus TaxID=1297742 RepID=A0A0H4XNQ7_9BACT|nr:transglycosylase SLT domain-containing protein [Myxococcus hansupus]AKQ69992.1 Soluble lytic murein transglycosylase [Myxococcus hansupus]
MRLSPLSGSATSAIRSPAQDVSVSRPSASLTGPSGATGQKPSLGRLGMQQDGFDAGGSKQQALGNLIEGAMQLINTLVQLQQSIQGGGAAGAQGAQGCGTGAQGVSGAQCGTGASPFKGFEDSSFSPASSCGGGRPPVELNPGAQQGPSPFMNDPVEGLTQGAPAGGPQGAPAAGGAAAAPVGDGGGAPAAGGPVAPPDVGGAAAAPAIDGPVSAPSIGSTSGASGGKGLGGNLPPALEKLRPLIESAAAKAGVPAEMIAAQVWAESRGDVSATSTNGGNGLTDTGLMQVNPNTFKELQAKYPDLQGKDLSDPATNILAGAFYMKDMKEQFGSIDLALRAYNSGPNGVDKSNPHAIPAGTGDANYVKKVSQFMDTLASGQGTLPA